MQQEEMEEFTKKIKELSIKLEENKKELSQYIGNFIIEFNNMEFNIGYIVSDILGLNSTKENERYLFSAFIGLSQKLKILKAFFYGKYEDEEMRKALEIIINEVADIEIFRNKLVHSNYIIKGFFDTDFVSIKPTLSKIGLNKNEISVDLNAIKNKIDMLENLKIKMMFFHRIQKEEVCWAYFPINDEEKKEWLKKYFNMNNDEIKQWFKKVKNKEIDI